MSKKNKKLEPSTQMHRREFLSTSIGLTSSLFAANTLTRSLFAEAAAPHTLVVVFLRGAMDPLSLVAPKVAGIERTFYNTARPNIGIPTSALLGIPGENVFGLNPNAARLQALMNSGNLRMVLGYGSLNPTTSHFEQQDNIENGYGEQRDASVSGGFLNRTVYGMSASQKSQVLAAATMGVSLDKSLMGPQAAGTVEKLGAPAIGDLTSHTAGLSVTDRLALGYESPRDSKTVDIEMRNSGTSLKNMIPVLTSANSVSATLYPDNGGYSGTDRHYAGMSAFPKAIRLMKAEAQLRVITINVVGWDHHYQQGPMNDGTYATLIKKLSYALEAFAEDLKRNSLMNRTSVVVHTEFGRTVRENATLGSDHGRGGLAMVIGENVGTASKLKRESTIFNETVMNNNYLRVDYDYRQILAEIMVKKMGVVASRLNTGDTNSRIFPGLGYAPLNIIG